MDEGAFRAWLEAYFEAWVSNDPRDVEALFAEEARYWTGPFKEPWHGREAIVERWTGGPASTEVDHRFRILGVRDDTGVAWWQVTQTEEDGRFEMDGILLIRFDDEGRCLEHREWFERREADS